MTIENNQDVLLMLKDKRLRFGEIRKALNLNPSTLNRRLDELASEKLITIVADQENRCFLYTLTELGTAQVTYTIPELRRLKEKLGTLNVKVMA